MSGAALLLLALAGGPGLGAGESPPPASIESRDAVRLAEAFSLMSEVQDDVWPGWSRAPVDLLLVEGEREYLLRSQAQPPRFAPAPDVAGLPGGVRVRGRSFPPAFLATFPAFGATPTIVVGTPEATGKRSTAWVLTLLHEHFHQLQYSDPAYIAETKALGLSGGDETGMWMLEYPFPYAAQSAAFAALARRLADLVDAPSAPGPEARAAFWADYAAFCAALEPRDYRYLSLQLWQEGIARYVELRAAEAAARGHRVPAAFSKLHDYEPYAAAAASLRAGIVGGLRKETMAAEKRIVFYAFGAGLGLLLDQEGVPWKDRYLREKFYLEKYRP